MRRTKARLPSIVLSSAVLLWSTLAPAQNCGDWQAHIISVEGKVELKRAQSEQWLGAGLNDTLCMGDSLRLQAYSRAAVALPDETVVRLDQYTTITFSEPRDEKRTWLSLLKGVIHVISRDPRALRVTTPFANAGLEGTEFSVKVTDKDTDVAVYEGAVTLSNGAGTRMIRRGKHASAQSGNLGSVEDAPAARDALQWALHYLPVLDGRLPPADAPVAAGDVNALVRRAARRLSLGRTSAADDDLDSALALAPNDPDALALRSVMALARGDTGAAMEQADKALAEAPGRASALIARSYAQQAKFDLPAARRSLERAVAADPDNALARARLAEIALSAGDVQAALSAANRAEALNPTLSLPHSVTGFARLRQSRIDVALDAFREAISLDPASPLPRLGRGLALVRQGHFQAGRAAIEQAVILHPNDALIRSYMGKAYSEENRTRLADMQLDMAKGLRPDDPTPWLYDALQKQADNQPVRALRDLQRTVRLNGDRLAYRSRLRLDEDLAARSTGLGRIYRNLGFEQLALQAGWRSVLAQPDDFSGHRLLADSYSSLPRHQIARVSEQYQAQLLQPSNLTPLQPELGDVNLFILDSVGPSDLASGDYNPLFERNRLALQGSGITAGNGTRGDNVVVSGLRDRFSFNLGQFHFHTDGFRQNNDFQEDILSGLAQYRATDATSLQLELRSTKTDKGDLQLLFDPDNFNPYLRQSERVNVVRTGLSHLFSRHSRLLTSLSYQHADVDSYPAPGNTRLTQARGYRMEVEHLYAGAAWRAISGVGYLTQDVDEFTQLDLNLPVPPFRITESNRSSSNVQYLKLYEYAFRDLGDSLTLTIGGSAERLTGLFVDKDTLNPKIGLDWQVTSNTSIRAAAFRTLQGPLISKQSAQPTLEPTEVSGFNQFYFGTEGETGRRFGLGLDHHVSDGIAVGGELSRRLLQVPVGVFLPSSPSPVIEYENVDEDLARAYGYWTPTDRVAVSAAASWEHRNNHGEFLAEGFSELRTTRLPVQLNYFRPNGLRGGLQATYVDQSGVFGGHGSPAVSGEDRFWVVDLNLGYRLPRKRGLVELNVKNLFDRRFRFQDTDPENPRIMPERLAALRFTLSF